MEVSFRCSSSEHDETLFKGVFSRHPAPFEHLFVVHSPSEHNETSWGLRAQNPSCFIDYFVYTIVFNVLYIFIFILLHRVIKDPIRTDFIKV